MNDEHESAITGGDTETTSYFTPEQRESMEHWRKIVATMPPMTQDEINRIGALFSRIDARQRDTK
ncbi:hypothetical protein BBK82_09180 [Lentzea guizhouensis]|uniref:Uncharacterized protein n=1 Tax=Lentzea guizhouensis TaxID=1586287 RepID=A0A1B2HES6_9PSEU|nr:hypothetical protein [Lentzea guizhouensis]ANZ36207.1 hypothetical protein BBK82_09180 [Lentzea guizhouensis]